MDDNPDDVQKQIELTKASLVKKLEALEEKTSETVQTTSDSISETVATVKEAVQTVAEKVHSASEVLSLRSQMQRHPWWILGGAVTLGCMGAYLLGGSRSKDKNPVRPQQESAPRAPEPEKPVEPQSQDHRHANGHSKLWDRLGDLLGLGIGSAMGVVRDLTVRGLPQGLQKEVAAEVDRWTTSLGGKPIEGSIIPSSQPQANHPAENPASEKQPAA